jgi:ABC-type uncharacterized transport system substrate-binding protein
MNRRAFITLLGGAAAWPLAARAQQARKLPTIGFLGSGTPAGQGQWVAAFLQRLRELGWTEGKNVNFEYRWSGGAATPLPTLAQDLVSTNPDVIVVASTPGSQAVHKATSQIPVVFMGVSDPVASGIVASLARPGGNITSVSNFLPATAGKLLELLTRIMHHVTRFCTSVEWARASGPSGGPV